MQMHSAYRFGLHLFDYSALFPNLVGLGFCVGTDRGESRSGPNTLSYFIGQDVPGHARYALALNGLPLAESDDAVRRRAYDLWERAGRPEGRSEAFWFSAQARGEQAVGAPWMRKRPALPAPWRSGPAPGRRK